MAGILRVPRSRGAFSGLLLVLLGAWGALIPFIGPYFHYAFTPDHAWTYNTDRLWLEVLPGAAVLLGGLIALLASTRPTAVFGTWLAALGGAWFVLGRPLSTLWTTGGTVAAGHAVGGTVTRAAEDIGFFTGLGVVILFFAAMALGRFTVVGIKEATVAGETLAADKPVVADTVPATSTTAGTKWRPFAKQTATEPATDGPATGAVPAAAAGRPVGKHSASSSGPSS